MLRIVDEPAKPGSFQRTSTILSLIVYQAAAAITGSSQCAWGLCIILDNLLKCYKHRLLCWPSSGTRCYTPVIPDLTHRLSGTATQQTNHPFIMISIEIWIFNLDNSSTKQLWIDSMGPQSVWAKDLCSRCILSADTQRCGGDKAMFRRFCGATNTLEVLSNGTLE